MRLRVAAGWSIALIAAAACGVESGRDGAVVVVTPGASAGSGGGSATGGAGSQAAGAGGVLAAAGTAGAPDAGVDAPPDAPKDAAPDAPKDAAPDAPKDAAPDAPPKPAGPTRYPYGPRHSPLTASVVARLKAIAAKGAGRADVFAKVGDSITVNTGFLACFAKSDVMLGSHGDLGPTVDFFKKTSADGAATSFDRTTLAAVVGWSASKAAGGSPSPIEQEVAAIKPAYAVVMLGTNDTYEQGVAILDKYLRLGVDQLLALGVVPLVSTIPPRGDKADANRLVPEMNAVVRAVAEERGVPLMDYWQTLTGLADFGLAGDGVHPQSYVSGGAHPCWLTDAALSEGVNQRNLITLESLDRARRILGGTGAPDPDPPALAGAGTHAAPYVVDALPFVHHGDTTTDGDDGWDTYGCSTANEGGREVLYRVTLGAPRRVSVRVFSSDGADVDVHVLSSADPSACVARDDRHVELDLVAGTHFVSVDTFVASGKPLAGPYRVTIVPVE